MVPCVLRRALRSHTTYAAGVTTKLQQQGTAAITVKPVERTFDVPVPLKAPTVFDPPSRKSTWTVGPHKPPPESWVRDFVTDTRKQIIALPRLLFDAPARLDVIHRTVVWQRAALRAGTASTKHRGEVRGSTRKVYAQKGRGAARHGAITAPIFRGGGIVFGPKPKDWSFVLPKGFLRLGLRSAMTLKFIQGHVEIVDKMTLDVQKGSNVMSEIQTERGWKTAFLVDTVIDGHLASITRNMPALEYVRAEHLNVYDIMKYEKLVMTTDVIDYLMNEFHENNDDPFCRVPSVRAFKPKRGADQIPKLTFRQNRIHRNAVRRRNFFH